MTDDLLEAGLELGRNGERARESGVELVPPGGRLVTGAFEEEAAVGGAVGGEDPVHQERAGPHCGAGRDGGLTQLADAHRREVLLHGLRGERVDQLVDERPERIARPVGGRRADRDARPLDAARHDAPLGAERGDEEQLAVLEAGEEQEVGERVGDRAPLGRDGAGERGERGLTGLPVLVVEDARLGEQHVRPGGDDVALALRSEQRREERDRLRRGAADAPWIAAGLVPHPDRAEERVGIPEVKRQEKPSAEYAASPSNSRANSSARSSSSVGNTPAARFRAVMLSTYPGR